MDHVVKECSSLEHSKTLEKLIEDTDKFYGDCEAVLLVTVETTEYKCICTITKVTGSVAQADALLQSVDQYAHQILRKIRGMLATDNKYYFTVIQYLPKEGIVRRHFQGLVATQTLH